MNKYGTVLLPAELTTVNSIGELKEKLYQLHDKNVKGPIKKCGWYDDEVFAYVFPDGSFCSICISNNSDEINWEYVKNLYDFNHHSYQSTCYYSFLNYINSPDEVLKDTNPYAYQFAKEEDVPAHIMLCFPKLEQLKKANYRIADTIINNFQNAYRCGFSNTQMQNIYRIFHKGTSLYDIIGFSKDVAKEMKDVSDIDLWTACRKLYNKKMLDVESVRFLKMGGYSRKDIRNIYSVVSGIDGKQYFTIASLLRHLRRLDMYEAIDTEEALQLLSDYIRCCHALDVTPRFDTDSLKREHDVMARNARTKIAERQKQEKERKMANACKKLQEYNYEESVFFVRGIKSFDDLLDEATQQSNCVACYANSIANKSSKIFVMREKANPDKSLITIELSPDNKLRQKYLSHNRPVHNKAQTDFINRWLAHIRSVA